MPEKIVERLKCYICLRPAENHHIRTRKSGGGDEKSNLIPLCRKHHTEIHTIGVKSMTKKYKLPIDASQIYPTRSDI